ncbi:MAG: DUF4298 domain-containing protein [Neisseria sp.]|nr:DUF4298 domain-containing protein [Neisseria sp.]
MNHALNLPQAQARINEIQTLYREWLALLPQLQAAQAQWRRSEQLMRQMIEFYENGEYGRYFQAVSDGLPLTTETQGEYSILSEDALYDAFGEHRNLAIAWLKLAVRVLDNEKAA